MAEIDIDNITSQEEFDKLQGGGAVGHWFNFSQEDSGSGNSGFDFTSPAQSPFGLPAQGGVKTDPFASSASPFGQFWGGVVAAPVDTGKKPVKKVVRPSNMAKMILVVGFVGVIFMAGACGYYINEKFSQLGWSMKNLVPQNLSTDSSSSSGSNVNAITFGGQQLTGQYNADQIAVLKMVDGGQSLSTVQQLLLERMIHNSDEINAIVRTKFKNYYE